MDDYLSFEDLSNTRVSDIEEPKPHPHGTYLFSIVSGDFKEVESESDKAPVANASFACRAVEAFGDVDEDELAATEGSWESESVWHRIPIFNRADRYKVVKFAATLGFDVEGFDGGLDELCKALTTYRFTAYVDHRIVGDDVYINLKSIKSAA